jgi:hypothetical protein
MPLVPTDAMTTPSATPLQRLGELAAFVEALLFGLAAALHLGIEVQIGSLALSQPVNVLAAIFEGVIALGLVLAVLMPGRGALRAGRVIGAQVLAVIGVLVSQIALAYGVGPRTRGGDLMHVVMLAIAFASMLAISWPRNPARVTEPAARPTKS